MNNAAFASEASFCSIEFLENNVSGSGTIINPLNLPDYVENCLIGDSYNPITVNNTRAFFESIAIPSLFINVHINDLILPIEIDFNTGGVFFELIEFNECINSDAQEINVRDLTEIQSIVKRIEFNLFKSVNTEN